MEPVFIYRETPFDYWQSDVDGKDIFECPDHSTTTFRCRVCLAAKENRALYRLLSSFE